MLTVPLTSVRQPMHTIGWTAADLLLQEAAPDTEPQHVLFEPELVVRGSTVARP